MPDYKRKRVKKSFKPKSTRIARNTEKVKKKSNKSGIVPEGNIKVIRGNKFKRKQKTKFLLSVALFISLICIVLSLVLPVGLYENIINWVSITGPGSYPISVSGSTILNTVSSGSYYFVLTDTSVAAYSNSGKIIFNELHGFSNPIISASSTRALVYDQGEKSAHIYNLTGKIHTLNTENTIITASISRNGDFAVATHSDSYTSVATVYDKNFKTVFTWNSAKDIISNVLVNNGGNRLAVTTLNAVSGQYTAKLSIFNFKSADPLHTVDLNNSLPISIINTGKGISIICNDKYKFLNWSKFTSNEITASGEVNMLRNSKNGLLLVFNRVNDRTDNTVLLISKRGEKISDFKLKNELTDIQYKNGRIYAVSDSNAIIYDKNGAVLRQSECSYGIQKIAVISSHSIACITDNEILKTNIERKEG